MNWRALAIVFTGFAGLLVFLYWGLNTAERGIQELLAVETPLKVFSCTFEEKGISIFCRALLLS